MSRILLLFCLPIFVFICKPVFSESLQLIRTGNHIEVTRDQKPFLRYLFDDVPYKPYVKEFYTPGGTNVLRDAPPDHLHHHGLMYAIIVDGVDFWEEMQAPGLQKTVSISRRNPAGGTGDESVAFAGTIQWSNPRTGEVLLLENREIRPLLIGTRAANVATWVSSFSLPGEKERAVLSGRKYLGLGVRFPASMDKGGHFFNADGGTGVEGTDDKNSKWCAYRAGVDGHPVTVAVFDDPANPRSPANWYTMDTPFAYISATLGLDVTPLVLEREDTPLRLRYGFAAWDGEIPPEKIDATYREWLETLDR